MPQNITYHNPEREPLRLREYGRNVQKMVALLQEETDNQKRQAMAEQLIRIMKTVTPNTDMDPKELEKKLWDHLFRMAGYDLQVEAPVEITEHTEDEKPERLPYYNYQSTYKQYGKNVELMIQQAQQMEDAEKREAYELLIANHMKQCLKNRNAQSQPSDEVVVEQLAQLSGGKIKLAPEDTEDLTVLPPASNQGGGGSKKKKRKKRNRGRRNNPNNQGGGSNRGGGGSRSKRGGGGNR